MCPWMCHGLATEQVLNFKFRRCENKCCYGGGPIQPTKGAPFRRCIIQLSCPRRSMSCLITTVTTIVCSAYKKAFGSAYTSCLKHVSNGKVNWCRDHGAVVEPRTSIVSRHDRKVAGRHAEPLPPSHADRDSESGRYDCESEPEPGPAVPGSDSGYPNISQNIS